MATVTFVGLQFILLFLLTIKISSVISQGTCTNTGPGAVSRSAFNTNNAADTFFMISNDQTIDCYGSISSWSYRTAVETSYRCYSMYVQIWRPDSPVTSSPYRLVGTETLFDEAYCNNDLSQMNNDSSETVGIPPNHQIQVQPGDVIAWYDSQNFLENPNLPLARKVGFDPGLPGSTYTDAVSILSGTSCQLAIGQSCPWETASIVGRNYGIEWTLAAGQNPIILNLPKTVTIDELLPAGTFIYRVLGNNSFTWMDTMLPQLTYEITGITNIPPTNDCKISWFNISQDGSVRVNELFDINFYTNAISLTCQLNISVSQGLVLQMNDVLSITIFNINEPHSIVNLPSTISLDSSLLLNPQQVFGVQVDDPDPLLLFSQKIFLIVTVVPPYNIFRIDATGNISTTTALDTWSGPDVFKINVTVSDGEYSAGPATLTVNLYNFIQPPVLINLPAAISLPENTPTGTVFTARSSADATRGAITYEITSLVPYSGVGPDAFSITNIAAQLGDVTLDVPLDVTVVSQYAIQIQSTLTYNGLLLASNQETLTVDVTWVNQPPKIIITPIAIDVEIPEDTPIGSTIRGLSVTARDREVDNNLGDWLFFFTNDARFLVDNITGTMYTTSFLLLSPNVCSRNYPVTVTVRDSFGLSDTEIVQILVISVNLHSPQFSQDQYNGNVSESSVAGDYTSVTLIATDEDCADVISYSILEPLANLYFQVDPSNGAITVKQPISYPTYPSFTFTAVATDNGNPPLNATAVVVIEVTPSNMHPPYFNGQYIQIESSSEPSVGSNIYTLNVTDSDDVSVNVITYHIVVLQDNFQIDPPTGSIYPIRKLKPYHQYLLYVMATDTGLGEEYFSDPVIIVVDTYKASRQMIDITMLRPLSETYSKLTDDFMVKLNVLISPWYAKIEDVKYKGDNTVVTIYAQDLQTIPLAEFDPPHPKQFIDRDQLLGLLRTDIYGTPSDDLRRQTFDDYEVISVMPTYPNWMLDTVEGIATLTVICVVGFALIVVGLVLLTKRFKIFCFKENKVSPEKPIPSGDDEFMLNYVNNDPPLKQTAEITVSDLEPFSTSLPPYKSPSLSPPYKTPSLSPVELSDAEVHM